MKKMVEKIKRQIPNAITGMNLFAGSISIVYAFDNQLEMAFYLILLAAVFDFFDGFVARLLNVQSVLGKELDSLADVVSFGLAPAVIMFQFFQSNMYVFGWESYSFLPYISFIIPVFSAFRLAKFNLDTRQSESFLGLPTPANALFIGSYVFLPNFFNIAHHPLFLTVLIIVMSLLLVSELPMFSLKIKSLKIKGNAARYFIISFVIGMIFFVNHLWLGAIAISMYILLNGLLLLKKRT